MEKGTKPTVAGAKKTAKQSVMLKQDRVVQQLLTIMGETGMLRALATRYGEFFGELCEAFPVSVKAANVETRRVPVKVSEIDRYVNRRLALLKTKEQEAHDRILEAQRRYRERVSKTKATLDTTI